MTWPTHGTGSTTPEDGREDPDYEDYEDPDSPRRGRHAYPDPLPPLEARCSAAARPPPRPRCRWR